MKSLAKSIRIFRVLRMFKKKQVLNSNLILHQYLSILRLGKFCFVFIIIASNINDYILTLARNSTTTFLLNQKLQNPS